MNALELTATPIWTALGWTILHFVWIGAVIGVLAAATRFFFRSAGQETRHAAALGWLLVMALLPVAIFLVVFEPEVKDANTSIASVRVSERAKSAGIPVAGVPIQTRPRLEGLAVIASANGKPWRLETIVPYLPALWLVGSCSTFFVLTTGLIGVHRLRRSSRILETGPIRRRLDELGGVLGIARHVSVGICDRLAVPVLVGIVRPLVLLPSSALCGWSMEQLEMVLIHELAHLRRWDNVVNLLQRIVESLLFFHPVVWWLSGWVRLEPRGLLRQNRR